MSRQLSNLATDIVDAGMNAVANAATAESIDRAVDDAVVKMSLDSSLRCEGEGKLVTALTEIAKAYVRDKARVNSD